MPNPKIIRRVSFINNEGHVTRAGEIDICHDDYRPKAGERRIIGVVEAVGKCLMPPHVMTPREVLEQHIIYIERLTSRLDKLEAAWIKEHGQLPE